MPDERRKPDFSDPIVVLEVWHLDGTVTREVYDRRRGVIFVGCRQIGKTRKTPGSDRGFEFQAARLRRNFTTLPPSRALTLTGFLSACFFFGLGRGLLTALRRRLRNRLNLAAHIFLFMGRRA